MKRFCLSFLFLVAFIFSVFPDSYNETAGSGLFINSNPFGAKVYIDGIERGTTPYRNSSIRSGEYSIRVTKEGYGDRRFTVIIRTGSCVDVLIDLELLRGQVILEFHRDPAAPASHPFDPRITVDGSGILNQDIVSASVYEYRINLAEGWRTIAAEAFGWERISERVYVQEGSLQKIEFSFTAAEFVLTNVSLKKKRLNPRNPGALGNAEINFTVNAPGRGFLEVFDAKGELIYSYTFAPFDDWQQKVFWNGKNNSGDIVDDGTYTLVGSVWDNRKKKKLNKEFSVAVDSSMVMRPLSISSSSAGLMFVPFPELLPAFSYQIEASVLAGKLFMSEEVFKSQPVALGVRISFSENLELTTALGVVPELPDGAEWELGTSLKWVFFRPQSDSVSGFSDALGLAAELSYGWSLAGPYTVFGMGTGVGLRLPLLYRLVSGETRNAKLYYFDVLLSPLVLWAGENGYPDSFVPRLGIEGGLFFSFGGFAAGISGRWDYAPGAEGAGPLVSALELKIFPSNCVIAFTGGYWYSAHKHNSGAFFGLGFGFMN
jgi:hypothetical protein